MNFGKKVQFFSKQVIVGKKTCFENKKKLASYSHRTATTAHPCYIPILGDSAGAGRMRLARATKVRHFLVFQCLLDVRVVFF